MRRSTRQCLPTTLPARPSATMRSPRITWLTCAVRITSLCLLRGRGSPSKRRSLTDRQQITSSSKRSSALCSLAQRMITCERVEEGGAEGRTAKMAGLVLALRGVPTTIPALRDPEETTMTETMSHSHQLSCMMKSKWFTMCR